MFCCADCERYIEADGDRPKTCPATGRKVWPGDSAEECPFLFTLIKGEALKC
ncbi:MAG: hypothetical protein ACOYJV_01585 [Aminivibrio sp.]|jgi:hypothetical protein